MRAYLAILSVPGAWRFSAAALLTRSGGAMTGIGTVLMVRAIYGEYALAGLVSAAHMICWAAGSPVIARLVDRYGQRRIMLPTMTASAIAFTGLVIAAACRAPGPVLAIPSALAGLTAGSIGPLVRARWSHVLDDPGKLHTAFSLEGALDEVTFIIGPVLATLLATQVAPTAGLIVPIVLSMAGALVFFAQRRTEPPVRLPARRLPGAARPRRSGLALLIPGVAPVAGVCLGLGWLFGACDLTVVAAVEAWGSKGSAGLVLAAFSASSALAGLTYGARAWTAPLWRRYVLGTYLLVLMGSLLLATSPLTLAVCGLVAGLAVGPTLINATALIQRLVPADRLTEGLTWVNTAIGVGVAAGSSLSGGAVDRFGPTAGFLTVAGVGLLVIVTATASAPGLRRAYEAAAGGPAHL
ncbi:MAG: MFS transporter [Bifidobacteriaceae bacterium]|jgi:MFS family permease|nr:MFS transporter [Bifidobacteriaceae bacterium]